LAAVSLVVLAPFAIVDGVAETIAIPFGLAAHGKGRSWQILLPDPRTVAGEKPLFAISCEPNHRARWV
jgi:hypothetical protein